MKAASSLTGLLAGAALAMLGACSSDGGDTVTLGASSQAVIRATCNYLQKCSPQGVAIQYGDVAGCVSSLDATSGDNLPGNTATDAQISACADAINALSCDDDPSAVSACHIKGSLESGTACNGGGQCQTGYCQVDASASASVVGSPCGTCAAVAADGAACTDDDGCNPGSACDPAKKVCAPRPAKGAACSAEGVDCQNGLACIADVCTTPLPAGSACASTDNAPCARGLICAGGKCTDQSAFVNIVDVGAACGVDTAAQKDNVCKFSSCVGAAGAEKCVEFATEGQACSDGSSSETATAPACAPPSLGCVSGKCVKLTLVVCK